MKGRGGFTLLELMIVVIIIAVLAAIAIPRITVGTAAARASRAAHTISNYHNFIKACQSAGIAEGPGAGSITDAVAGGLIVAGVDIQPPLIGTNSDGMWTYTYQTGGPTITATKNVAPQATNTIIYNINTNLWTGTYTPPPTSA